MSSRQGTVEPPAPDTRSTTIPTSPARRSIRTAVAAALTLAALLTAGCGSPAEPAPTDAPPQATPAAAPPGSSTTPDGAGTDATIPGPAPATDALTLLATLPIRGRAPKTGYERDNFGQRWTDDVDVDGGHNGCDTRNDILGRDLTVVVTRGGANGCKVLTGVLFDEYTGETVDFLSGEETSPLVQIDHVVALSNAWQTGAQQLDEATRTALSNDPLNLQAVGGAVNQQKSDGDAATWLPPRKEYRCRYIQRQIQVKARYGLWVTQAEHDAMSRELGDCAGAERDASPRETTGSSPEPESVHFASCAAARAAGAAPMHAGEPGYRTGLDGDGDGTACEPVLR